MNLLGKSPKARYEHCSVSVSDRMFIFGGSDRKTKLDDLWIFDTGKNSSIFKQT